MTNGGSAFRFRRRFVSCGDKWLSSASVGVTFSRLLVVVVMLQRYFVIIATEMLTSNKSDSLDKTKIISLHQREARDPLGVRVGIWDLGLR
jgi:hypothetical protein